MKPAPRVGAWLRLLAGFLLLQLAGAQLWPALHHALIRHAVCAEHGEFVHVEAHADHAASDAGKTPAVSASEDGDDAHDHCQLPPGLHDPAAEPAEPPSVLTSTSTGAAPSAAPSEALARSIPILSLAPKQSPPS
ncbi:MAG TPA: hypothetical protein VM686_10000 [Polyangiaceae bacterium]|nr:hypothetical protein [Polyangiaceae bacterium]